jgi:hypothetical protein
MHLAFYSCELELNFSIKGNLNGINPEIRAATFGNASPVAHIHGTKGRSSIV